MKIFLDKKILLYVKQQFYFTYHHGQTVWFSFINYLRKQISHFLELLFKRNVGKWELASSDCFCSTPTLGLSYYVTLLSILLPRTYGVDNICLQDFVLLFSVLTAGQTSCYFFSSVVKIYCELYSSKFSSFSFLFFSFSFQYFLNFHSLFEVVIFTDKKEMILTITPKFTFISGIMLNSPKLERLLCCFCWACLQNRHWGILQVLLWKILKIALSRSCH